MKRGRKSKAELAELAQRPADIRAPWQIEQAARCGCRGTDDLCACQNENPWPRPAIDWQARAQAAEARIKALEGALSSAIITMDAAAKATGSIALTYEVGAARSALNQGGGE